MRFTKMHGLGNDYVYVNCFEEQVENPGAVARYVSDRHFGIGSDGLILIKPSDIADFEMEMYNADGSRGAMCGNGIRCVAKYVYDYGLTDKTGIDVATGSGIKHLELTVENGKVALVRADMGAPILEPQRIPVDLRAEGVTAGGSSPASGTLSGAGPEAGASAQAVIDFGLRAGGKDYRMTCVSMGSAHCIVPVDDVESLDLEKIGPLFENHPAFPDRINTEFIRVLDRKTVQMRVWERGSGETLACGSGSSAVAVACALNGWTEDEITVRLLGGELRICWDRAKNTVFMTGPAAVVFDGEIELPPEVLR